MYAVHFRFIEKPVVDFLIVIIKLCCEVLRLRRYERKSTEIRHFKGLKGVGYFGPKFQVEETSPINHFLHGYRQASE